MPISGLRTRGDLMSAKIIPQFRDEQKAFSSCWRALPRFVVRQYELLEQLRVETTADLSVIERNVGLAPLGIHLRPLSQRQRLIGEHQRQGTVPWAVRTHQRKLDLAGQTLHPGHRNRAG